MAVLSLCCSFDFAYAMGGLDVFGCVYTALQSGGAGLWRPFYDIPSRGDHVKLSRSCCSSRTFADFAAATVFQLDLEYLMYLPSVP